MMPIIKADKNCKHCGGSSRCQTFSGGVSLCECITNQIDIRNDEDKRPVMKLSENGNHWDLTFEEVKEE